MIPTYPSADWHIAFDSPLFYRENLLVHSRTEGVVHARQRELGADALEIARRQDSRLREFPPETCRLVGKHIDGKMAEAFMRGQQVARRPVGMDVKAAPEIVVP